MSGLKIAVGAAAWSVASWATGSTLCDMGEIANPLVFCHGAAAEVLGNYRLVDAVRPTLSTVKRFSGETGETGIWYPAYNNDQSYGFQLYAIGLDGGFTYAESNAGTYGWAEATRSGVLRGTAVALAISPQQTRPYWMMATGHFANTYHATWNASLGLSMDLPLALAAHGYVQAGPPDPEKGIVVRTTLQYAIQVADADRHRLGSAAAKSFASGTVSDTLHVPLRLTADYVQDGIAHSRFVVRGAYNLTAAFGGAVYADNTFRLGFQIPEAVRVMDAVDGSIVSSVPEPPTAVLAAVGLLPLAAWRQRRRLVRRLR